MQVSTFMSKNIVDIEGSMTVLDGVKIMKEKSVGSLLVKEEGEYVGIFTPTDLLLKVIEPEIQPDWMNIADAMTRGLVSVPHDSSMILAFLTMEKNGIRHLVVKEDGKVVGILSIKDVARFYVEKFGSK